MRRIFHSEEHEQTFSEQGFIKVPWLSKKEVAELLEKTQALNPADNFNPDNSTGSNQSTYHCTFLDNNTIYKRAANELIKKVFEPYIDKLVKDYAILTSNFYVKPPNKGTFEIHQNWPTTANLKETTLTFWIPLVDTYAENGALQVVPGSHKIVPDIASTSVPPFFKSFEEALINKYLQPIPMKAGECIAFCDSLIHWSALNTSDSHRYAIQIATIPKESTPALHYFDPQNGFELVEVDYNFFIENSIEAIIQRPLQLKSLGFIPNNNKAITEEEFAKKLRNGNEIRRNLNQQSANNSLKQPLNTSGSSSWVQQLKTFFSKKK